MATLIALMDVTAEGGSSAERNIPERSFLLSAERISKPRSIFDLIIHDLCYTCPT